MILNFLPSTSAKFTKRNTPASTAEGARILASAKNAIIYLFLLLATLMPASLLAQENASAHDADAVAQRETHVTPAQALNVGYTFMRTSAGNGTRDSGAKSSDVRKQAMQLVYTGQAYDSLAGTVTDCYYVFALQPKGFVIVAADDRVEPILGYSYDNDFAVANMPDHVRAWLGSYEKQIQAVVKNNLQAEPAAQAKWSRLKSGQSTGTRSGGSVGPLLTTTWDQGQYYNSLCPADANGPGGHVWGGCVATAMAQIINYWEWPEMGVGTHSYSSTYGNHSANYGNTIYDYSIMPDALSGSSTPEQINAVATLIYHCGVSVNMDYGAGGSAAPSVSVPGALQSYFAYLDYGNIIAKSDYSDNDWEAILRNELDSLRPVYYSGSGTGGGHAFICDGYSDDGTFHINWGWSGYYNGNFTFASLTPGSNDFSSYQQAIIGISVTGPFLRCSHNALTLAAAAGSESEAKQLQIRGHSLGNNITVTAGNGFTVSTDGSNFHNSLTLPQNGGNIYVKYTPVSSSDVSHTMTVVSGSHSLNINLYGTAYTEVCLPPSYLVGAYDGSAVNLSWNAPVTYSDGSPSSATLSWDSSFTCGRAGFGTDMTLYMMHRFDSQDLAPYNNYVLKSISFYAYTGVSSYRAVVFTGCSHDGNFTPGNLVVSQEIPLSTLTTDSWNTVLLNTPVLIDADEEIAFGVVVHNLDNVYVVPIGNGTFAPNKGQIFGIDYTQNPDASGVTWYDFCSILGENDNIALKGGIEKIAGNVSHYDIYRGSSLIGNSTTTSYTDNHTIIENTPYMVSAIWSSGCSADATVMVSPGTSTPPTVVSHNVTLVNPTTVTCGGNVTSEGSTSVTAKGVCWGTSPNPTITGAHTNDGSGLGEFTSTISELSENTTYYVRAYALNSSGISYGEQKTFTTSTWGTPCTLTFELNDSYGDGWTGNIIKVHNRGTTQTVTLDSGFSGIVTLDVYNGSLVLEWMSGNYTSECSFTVSGPCLYYQSSGIPTNGNFLSQELDCGGTSFLPDFTYNISNTCNSVMCEFTSAGENVQPVSWDFGNGSTSSQNPAIFEYTSSGTYTVSMTASSATCPTTATVSKTISVKVPIPSHTTFDTVVCAADLPLTWHGHTFTGPETYTGTFTTALNCDSTVTLNVTVGVLTAFLEDDFNDGVIDPAKWTYTGNTVLEEDGLLKLQQNVTDQDVHLRSVNLDVPADGKVSMDRRFMVHRSNEFYYGATCHYLNGNDNSYVNLQYLYTAYYDEGYYDYDNPRVGIYVTSNIGGEAFSTRLCDITFDTWLTEHVALDFAAGTLTYSTNTSTYSINVPGLASQTVDYYTVAFRPSGWWTGHQHYVDYVSIYGAEVPDLVTTSPVTNITANTATCGGNIPANDCILFNERGVCWSTSQNPTVADAHTSDGTGAGAFTSQLTGLEPSTTYYVRAYSINSMGTAYGEEVTFTTAAGDTPIVNGQPCPGTPTVTDIDGNVYNTVQIGNQCWTKENLRVAAGTSGADYANNTTPYYYIPQSPNTYGYYYNWPAAMMACPSGWHLPSNEEYTELAQYVGSQSDFTCGGNASYIAKALASPTGWNNSEYGYDGGVYGSECTPGDQSLMANNATGFSAVPAGICSYGSVYDANYICGFWTSTEYGTNYAYSRGLGYSETDLGESTEIDRSYGYSVRCLRNDSITATLPIVTTGNVSDITASTATCGGNVTSDGGASVTARGICWSTSQNPTVADAHTSDGTGAGAFTSQLTGLEPSTTYFVRAYATNSEGTVYGEEVTFTTANGCNGISIAITGNENVCETEPVVLTANVSADGFTPDNLHYTWYESGQIRDNMAFGLGDSNVYSEYLYPRTEPYLFSVEVYYGAGCVAQSGEYLVYVHPMSEVIVSASETAVCEGGEVTLSISCNDYNNPMILYTWYRNGVVIPGATQPTITDIPSAGNNIYTGVASLHGCSASDQITIHVNEIPETPIVTVDNTTIFDGGQVTLTVANPVDGAIYTWYRNGMLIDGATQATLVDMPMTIDGEATTYAYNVMAALNNSGCVSEISEPAVVTVSATPMAMVTVDGSTVLCEGGSTTLHVDVVPAGNPSYTYQWYEGDVLIPGATSADYVVTKPVRDYAYNFSVTVSDSNGGFFLTADAPAITVVSAPTVTIDGSPNVCYSGPDVANVFLTAWVNGMADPDATYVWYQSGQYRPNVNGFDNTYSELWGPSDGNPYSFTVEVTNGNGCTAVSEPFYVNVHPQPVVILGDSIMCEGGSMLFALTIPEADSDAQPVYTWYKDDQPMDIVSSDYILASEPGLYKVAVSVNGCTSESEEYYVTYHSSPQLQLTASETNICVGGHTAIFADVVNWSDGTILYSWSDSYGSGSSYDFSSEQAGLHTITVTATNTASGCQGTNSITINVNEIPETPVVTVNQATVFEGGQVTLTVANPVDGAIYTWYRNGMLIEGATQATLVDMPMTIDGEATTYAYNVMAALNNSGCVSEISEPAVVTVSAMPMAMVTVDGSTVFCEGSSTTLHVEVVPADNPSYTYQWYEGDVLIPGATSADYVVAEPARTTSYNFHVVVSANGSDNVTAYAPAVTVVSSPTVVASISESTVCAGGTATLTALVSGGVAGINGLNNYSYQWFRNADSTAELVSTDYTYTTAGDEPAGTYTYWVAISNDYGCNSQSESVMFTVADDPTVIITPAAGYNETVCDGGSTVLQANTTGGFGEISYQWYKNGLILFGENNQALALNNLYLGENYSYTVSVTQTGVGCAAISAPQVVNINAPVYTTLYETACDDYTWNGITYTATGDYSQTFTNANGCDSVVTLHLTVNYSNSGDTTAVANDMFDWYEHTYLTMSGDYTHVFTNQNGCDSVVTLHLTVNNPTISVQDTVLMPGYFVWHGMVFTSDTVLFEMIPVFGGYDSLVIYHVFVTPTPLTVLNVDTCVSYTLNGQTYTETGDYVQTFPVSGGMDSVVVLYLTIFPADSADFAETACELFTWEGTTYTTSGDYTKTLTNANGCDSVVTLHLTVFPADSADFAETACELFTWEETTYTTSGDYTKTLTNANGCDSVVTLHLTIFPADSADFAETACESFTWEGTTYTSSGDYTKTLTNANGCDSVVTLHLTVFPADSADFAETACESFTWEGTTYTSSGDYTKTFTNANGCDSVVTLHLTINQAVSSEFAVETADSCYSWNGHLYCESGDYTQTLTAANGCDSVVTLHLTITVGIDDHNLSAAMTVYPNPTNGIVNVQCTMNNVQVGTMEYHVFDAYGKLIRVVDGVGANNDLSLQTTQIDLSGFAAGVYFVKAVADGNVVAVRKVVRR